MCGPGHLLGHTYCRWESALLCCGAKMPEIDRVCRYCTLTRTIKLLLPDTSPNIVGIPGKTSSGMVAELFMKSMPRPAPGPQGLLPHPTPRPDACGC